MAAAPKANNSAERLKKWNEFKKTKLYKFLIDPKSFLKHEGEDYPYAKGLRNRIKDAFYHGYNVK